MVVHLIKYNHVFFLFLFVLDDKLSYDVISRLETIHGSKNKRMGIEGSNFNIDIQSNTMRGTYGIV